MLYCYSVFQTILDAKRSGKKGTLRNAVVRSVAPSAFGEKNIRDQNLSDMALGRAGLVDDIIKGAEQIDITTLPEYFRKNVIPKIKSTDYRLVVVALQRVIDEDDIDDDVIVDKVNRLSRREFLNASRISLADTLAGLFLFAVERNNNYNTNEYVQQIDSAFFDSLKDKANTVQIITEEERIDAKQLDSLISDAQFGIARAKNNRLCPHCAKPVVRPNENGIEIDYTDYVVVDGKPIVVCKMCKTDLEADPSQLPAVVATQSSVDREAGLISASSGNIPARLDIIAVLEAIDRMDESDITRIAEPVRIKDKIPEDRGLQKKVLNLVTPSFSGIQKILNDLAGQNVLNKDRIGDKISHMWEDMLGTPASQNEMFNALVQSLNEKSGRTHQSACETLVSYYIQRCDVFAVPQ